MRLDWHHVRSKLHFTCTLFLLLEYLAVKMSSRHLRKKREQLDLPVGEADSSDADQGVEEESQPARSAWDVSSWHHYSNTTISRIIVIIECPLLLHSCWIPHLLTPT